MERRLLLSNGMSDVLERGNIYFVYRPRVEQQRAAGLEDVQRFFMILSPAHKDLHRLIVIGRKKLPEIKDQHEREWGFVEKVSNDPDAIDRDLDRIVYGTKTRGERHMAAARPAGEGVYAIIRHDDHTHLAFALELPEQSGEVQEAFNIPKQGSYLIIVKNPDLPAPPGAGLSEAEKPELPRHLRARFGGRRFVPVDPPELLDRKGAEFVLIGVDEDVTGELGVRLNPQRETIETAEIVNDLHLEPAEHPLKPLLEGKWQ